MKELNISRYQRHPQYAYNYSLKDRFPCPQYKGRFGTLKLSYPRQPLVLVIKTDDFNHDFYQEAITQHSIVSATFYHVPEKNRDKIFTPLLQSLTLFWKNFRSSIIVDSEDVELPTTTSYVRTSKLRFELFDLMTRCTGLTSLSIVGCGLSGESFDDFLELLPKFKSFETLDLSQNDLSDDELDRLGEFIKSMTCLRRLVLNENPFTVAGIESLISALTINYSLHEIEFFNYESRHKITDKLTCSINTLLSRNRKTQIEHVLPEQDDVESYQQLINNYAVTNARVIYSADYINLNKLFSPALKKLTFLNGSSEANQIVKCENLSILRIQMAGLGGEKFTTILQQIQRLKKLTTLDLVDNSLSNNDLVTLAKFISKSTHLKVLKINENLFSNAGIGVIKTALEINYSLHEVDCVNMENQRQITHETTGALEELLVRNRQLESNCDRLNLPNYQSGLKNHISALISVNINSSILLANNCSAIVPSTHSYPQLITFLQTARSEHVPLALRHYLTAPINYAIGRVHASNLAFQEAFVYLYPLYHYDPLFYSDVPHLLAECILGSDERNSATLIHHYLFIASLLLNHKDESTFNLLNLIKNVISQHQKKLDNALTKQSPQQLTIYYILNTTNRLKHELLSGEDYDGILWLDFIMTADIFSQLIKEPQLDEAIKQYLLTLKPIQPIVIEPVCEAARLSQFGLFNHSTPTDEPTNNALVLVKQ